MENDKDYESLGAHHCAQDDDFKEKIATLEEQRESWRDNKRDLENDVALKTEHIAALTAENERLKSARACGNCPLLNASVKEIERLREALEDVKNRAIRIRENKAVVSIEARYIEDIAKDALKPEPGGDALGQSSSMQEAKP